MHDLAFADAARPTPVVVLKLPLCDYSLGHELLLLQRRNALLLLSTEDFNYLPSDQQSRALLEAVWLCSDPYRTVDRLSRPSLLDWRTRWYFFKSRRWQRGFNEGDFPLAIAEFRNYLAAGRSLPPAADPVDAAIAAGEAAPETGGRALGSPLLAGLINFASSRPWLLKGGSVMDVPFGYAGWLYFADMESDGRIKIENHKELEIRLETAEAKAESLAEEQADEGRESSSNLNPQPSTGNLATPPPNLTPDTPHPAPEDQS